MNGLNACKKKPEKPIDYGPLTIDQKHLFS